MNIDFDGAPEFPDLANSPVVDEVSVLESAQKYERCEVMATATLSEVDLAIRMLDLTTLEGADTSERVRQLCKTAMSPGGVGSSVPSVASVCVYPTLVGVASKALQGGSVKVASVAAAFPSGQARISQKVSEIEYAVSEGADEIDMVISRGKFLEGEYEVVFDEICQCREACGTAHLKVILETGELETLGNVRVASELAMAAGADFIKTSTGKISPAATFSATLVMLHAIRDFRQRTGRMVGMKPAGGIRTSEQALRYLAMLEVELGSEWMTPEWFRFGASSLAGDLVATYERIQSGAE